MSGITDLTGQKFGRLTVLRTFKGDDGHVWSECICECNGANIKLAKNVNLKGGHTKSCGCLRKEQLQRIYDEKKNVNSSLSKYSKHPYNKKLRTVWRVMIHRCYNENYKGYKYYGEKGTKVCQEWLGDYELFFEWSIKNGYKEGLSIDRIDFEKEYSPENCRWATIEVQANNTSQNVWVEYNGEKYTLTQLSKIFNCGLNSIQSRVIDGVYVHSEIREYVDYDAIYETINGQTLSIYEFADKYNITHCAIRMRYLNGIRGEDLIKPMVYILEDRNPEFGGFKRGDIVEYISKTGKNKFIGTIYSFSKNGINIGIKGNNKRKEVNSQRLTLIERPSEIK